MACSPKQAAQEPETAALKPKIDHWVFSAEGEPVLGVGCEKAPGSAICTKVWADGAGNPVDPRMALAELRKDHRSKHGALTIPTLKRLQAKSDDTQVHALVFAKDIEHPKLTAGESGIMFLTAR